MTELTIETLAIGDEILTGKISDTNSTFVADTLFKNGMRLTRGAVVLDDLKEIQAAMIRSTENADVVVVFGGLGPTSDDRTAESVAGLLKCALVEDSAAKEKMVEYYQTRNRPVTPQALKQIVYPEKASVLKNGNGMAPGFHCLVEKTHFFFLPGVPDEMKLMFVDEVLPKIKSFQGQQGNVGILARTWRCLNIFESDLQRILDPVEADLPDGAWLGYRTKFPENHLTLYFKEQAGEQRAQFEALGNRIGEILAPYAYSTHNEELEALIFRLLKERNLRIAFAESCTGGLTVQRLTQIPGSSDVVWGGTVVYQVDAKKRLLDVNVASAEAAVSAECTARLAAQLLKKSGCDVAAAVTGFAGPSGGTPADPVGTLYLCVIDRQERTVAKRILLPRRSREHLQWGAATHLLNAVREALEKSEQK